MTTTNWRVLGTRGCGSVIVEAALVLAELPYEHEELDYTTAVGRERLLAYNPLAQVPTVILPDGTPMTESLALILAIADRAPAAGLVPAVGDPLRDTALRYLAFLVTAIYPTFTYGDEPAKWVGESAGPALGEACLVHRQKQWRYLDREARGPTTFLGRFSAIDLYLAAMTRWRPGREWFATHAPKLHAVATTLDHDPRLARLWSANF